MDTNETPATIRENIAQMLKDNFHPSKIATDLQVSFPLIYKIKWEMDLTRLYKHKAETPADPVTLTK